MEGSTEKFTPPSRLNVNSVTYLRAKLAYGVFTPGLGGNFLPLIRGLLYSRHIFPSSQKITFLVFLVLRYCGGHDALQ